MKAILVLFMVGVSLVFSQPNYFMPTRIGSSARMIGQGSIEGFSPHAAVVFENPAGLARLSQWSLSLFKTTYLDEYQYNNVAVAYSSQYGYFGVGYYGASVNDILTTGYNSAEEITVTGKTAYQNTVFKLAYANQITPFLLYGITISRYATSLDPRSGYGTNVDVGLLKINNAIEWSFILKNVLMFNDVVYDNGQTENLPLEGLVSSKVDWNQFSFLGQVRYVEAQTGILKSGAVFYYLPFRKVYVSGGYKEFFSTIDEIQTSFTIGTGLVLGGVHLEYAYETSNVADDSEKHYFSLGLDF